MPKFPFPDEDQQEVAKDVFCARDAWSELTGEQHETDVTAIPFSRLYAFATNPDRSADPEISEALMRDAKLALHFHHLCEQNAVARLPRVAAAGNEPLLSRDGDGCRLRLEPSRAEPEQVYLIVELNDTAANPENLLLFEGGTWRGTYPLPKARDGIILLLEKHDSDLVTALRHPRSEVFFK